MGSLERAPGPGATLGIATHPLPCHASWRVVHCARETLAFHWKFERRCRRLDPCINTPGGQEPHPLTRKRVGRSSSMRNVDRCWPGYPENYPRNSVSAARRTSAGCLAKATRPASISIIYEMLTWHALCFPDHKRATRGPRARFALRSRSAPQADSGCGR